MADAKVDVAPVADIGIIGAGVMGSNLAMNIAEKKDKSGNAFHVSLYDRDQEKVSSTLASAGVSNLHGFGGMDKQKAFIHSMKKPRKVMLLVPAGKITDAVIDELTTLLDKDDIIIDTGNANFRDQDRRAAALEAQGFRFLGMGVSGGAEGARKGPAFFPGGTLSVWEEVRDIIEAAAAKADDGRPCATMNGKGGAGSCVKMFHNAGEYAVLQIWGEVHEIMRNFNLSPAEQKAILTSWKTKTGGRFKGLLDSYMLDITIEVVGAEDSIDAGGQNDGTPLISRTMDTTDSKGTGLWSVVEGLQAGVPAPSLCAAVLARQMSMQRPERLANATKIPLPEPPVPVQKWTQDMEEWLYWGAAISIIAAYAQMFQCLRKMNTICDFGLNLPATIATFRAGCILQGFLLEPMTKAFEEDPSLSNLIVAFEAELTHGLPKCKQLVAHVSAQTLSTIPCMYASLDYLQTMLSQTIPSAQCVSLQRDVFGRHGFERLDATGHFNAEWHSMQSGEAVMSAARSAVVTDVAGK